MTRRRLTPDQRRTQLIDLGARLFAERPYHEVRMDEVGAAAGVSRALVYRYFPSKRDLFAAVYRRSADELVTVTGPTPTPTPAPGPVREWVSAGLDAHFDYFAANPTTVLTANRDLAGDPVIQSIIADELATLRGRLLDALELSGARREVAGVALLAWLSFVRVSSVEWLLHGRISRDELHALCLRTLAAALGWDQSR
ncbi:TetR/AcrR family transcriptional regulator [Amycolatopsis jiangsuensis]|uniref:AcrR family transcriptional regulator n=1 Tax=Amycolatopsis jiangsuensis TaxID=1181879 RepID=A0A840IP92_9PSEU|nr:TetR/AcrR family transcriptional regulator [Amycolatopsis jiangsuensis]MBB4683703.1 AcrR family transcriptional regulator [Amycolatopsis jiangsuensis]